MKICLSTSLLLLLSMSLSFESVAQTSLRKTKNDKAHPSHNGVTGGVLKVLLSRLKCDLTISLRLPTNPPSSLQTNPPSSFQTNDPSSEPSGSPTFSAINDPSSEPSGSPTFSPSDDPSSEPSGSPTFSPSDDPSSERSSPTFSPSDDPSSERSSPTFSPTDDPSSEPSGAPTFSFSPTFEPFQIVAPDDVVFEFDFATLAISEERIVVCEKSENACYFYDLNGIFFQKVTAPDSVVVDIFGVSVAASGSTVVIGSENQGSDPGSVFVFTSDAAFIRKLTPPDETDELSIELFGASIAISSSIIIVGLSSILTGSYLYEVIFVYSINGSFISTLIPEDLSRNYEIWDVSVYNDIIVISYLIYTPNETDIVETDVVKYIFSSDGTQIVELINPVFSSADDYWGESVAVSNDVIVIGNPFDENIATDDDYYGGSSGAAYIFSSEGSFTKKMTAPDETSGDFFGYSVAISNDVIVIGAPLDDGEIIQNDFADDDYYGYYIDLFGSRTGSAYVFTSEGSFIKKLTAFDAALEDFFGIVVSVSNDVIVVQSVRSTYIFDV